MSIINMNEKSNGCSSHDHDVTCELASECTWWEDKCYTKQPCKGRTIPWSLGDKDGCYDEVYPHHPGQQTLPVNPKPDNNCLQAITRARTGQLGKSYSPDDCMKDMIKNKSELSGACKMSPTDLTRVMNWACMYLTRDDAKRQANEICNSVYNHDFPTTYNSCTVGKDKSNRSSGKWTQYTIANVPKGESNKTWYVYTCKNGPNCDGP